MQIANKIIRKMFVYYSQIEYLCPIKLQTIK